MGMDRDWSVGELHKRHLRRFWQMWCQRLLGLDSKQRKAIILTDGILRAETKLESVDLVQVKRIVVEHPDVQEPLFKVIGRHKFNARREGVAVDLCAHKAMTMSVGLTKDKRSRRRKRIAYFRQLFAEPLSRESGHFIDDFCACLQSSPVKPSAEGSPRRSDAEKG